MDNQTDNKPNFVETEKKILKWWYESGLIEKYLHRNDSSKKKFFFLDGPITANNPMGVHHAWGRTYKDLWQRYKNMQGFKQRFQNGFDCQGLWVEVEVEKELGLKNKKDIENLVPGDKRGSIDKFVNLCKERVTKFSSIQTEQSKRLGYFMDWDRSYYTNSAQNNYMIWYFLKKCHEKGLLYKGHDSVPWCYRCGIAISQHEILTEDYQELTHETIYFKLPLIGIDKTSLLVWTTTPWTIPANTAVAVNSREIYVKAKYNDEFVILMEKRYEALKNDLGLGEVVDKLSAEKMIGWEYSAPFDDLPVAMLAKSQKPKMFHRVVSGLLKGTELVTTDEGTGLLHVAPGAGTEDFQLGQFLDLAVISLINEDASYLSGLNEFSGLNAKIKPAIILDYVKQKNAGKFFLATRMYTHRYPVCWRCKTELVWRVVDEWYIKMSDELRAQMRKVVDSIRWIPDFGKEREFDWINNMHDWLISKKRYYGLCLPIYECEDCKTFEVVGSREELQQKAVEGFNAFDGHTPHRPWLDEVKIKCPNCHKILSRISDVGNVWLDAGIVTFSTLIDPENGAVSYMTDQKYFKEWYPADFITESFPGQFKNWFYSLLVMGTVLENHKPFETVLGFASLLAEDGKPMHKSNKKTFVSFDDGADKIGVDVLRWLYATHDPTQNLLFGYKVTDDVRRRFHLLLWNILNFYLTFVGVNKTLRDAKSNKNSSRSTTSNKNILDVWIILRLNKTIEIVTESLDKYDAHIASTEIERFVSDLSLWYVRRSRDRVSHTNTDLQDKNSCLSTLFYVLKTLFVMLAPFVPYFSEEMYQKLLRGVTENSSNTQTYDLKNSVHLTDWPEFKVLSKEDELMILKMEHARNIVEKGHAQRKLLGFKVRQPLAKITVHNSALELDAQYLSLIKDELNIKEVIISKGTGELSVELDTQLTDELLAEGRARELVRAIQGERKKLGCGLTEEVTVHLPDWPESYTEYLKSQTLTKKLEKGEFRVLRDKIS